jgi:hypothetical protein
MNSPPKITEVSGQGRPISRMRAVAWRLAGRQRLKRSPITNRNDCSRQPAYHDITV